MTMHEEMITSYQLIKHIIEIRDAKTLITLKQLYDVSNRQLLLLYESCKKWIENDMEINKDE